MAEFVEVMDKDRLKSSEMKRIEVSGRSILIAHVGDRFFAAEDRCPHFGARLSGGTLKGTVITCPRHGSKFDLVDGKAVRWTNWSGFVAKVARLLRAPRSIKTYSVKIKDGKILVKL